MQDILGLQVGQPSQEGLHQEWCKHPTYPGVITPGVVTPGVV